LTANLPLSALGLDSLMAIELKNQIEDQLGTSVPASKLMAGVTAAQLAQLVDEQLMAAPASRPAPSRPDEVPPTEAPLSYTQKALWFFQQLSPDSAAYNVTFALRISSPVDAGALRRAFQSIVNRHACLRTTFALRHGQPVQRVQRQQQADLREVSAAGLSLMICSRQ